MNLWRDRFPVMAPEDTAELESRAAVHELGDGLPRHQAEEKAYGAWQGRQLVHAAAHHLRGMRCAFAANQHPDAARHAVMYGVAMKALGHPVVGEPPPEIAALARDPKASDVYRFASHPADTVLLQVMRQNKGKPLAKGELVPMGGVPAETYPNGSVVWDMSHVLPPKDKQAGLRLHVRHGHEMTGFLFHEDPATMKRSPVATYEELDGGEGEGPHAVEWNHAAAVKPSTAPEKSVQRAFQLRRMVSRAEVAAAGKHVADLLHEAHRKLG